MVHINDSAIDDGGNSGGKDDGGGPITPSSSIRSLFLNYDQVSGVLGDELLTRLINEGGEMTMGGNEDEKDDDGNTNTIMLVWIGEYDGVQHWVLSLPTNFTPPTSIHNADSSSSEHSDVNDDNKDNDILQSISNILLHESKASPPPQLALQPLREFGDIIPASHEAAIHGTANALLEFHYSHPFCPQCGKPTILQKHGSSRICSNNKTRGGTCRSRSIYPRIDIASIMLVTSNCGRFALLGRKANWPKGRYSTLAGFLEVGETMEQCCRRETWEESGVEVDLDSVEFVQSQPWPFPRSLMIGFRARAKPVVAEEGDADGGTSDDSERILLPKIEIEELEMEDIRWFHRDFVAKRLGGGSTALSYIPTDDEEEFHIPGKASLARSLITQWAMEESIEKKAFH